MPPRLFRSPCVRPVGSASVPWTDGARHISRNQYQPLIHCATYGPSRAYSAAESRTGPPGPRWLAEAKARVGKCVTFGLNAQQTKEAGTILEELGTSWRELVAGSEGFLSAKDHRRGLHRHEVAWGDMDSMTQAEQTAGHVNNVRYNRWAESARVNWILHYGSCDPARRQEWNELVTPKGIGLILRSIRTDYKFPITYPDHVTVLHKLRSRPTKDADHFLLDVIILSETHQRPAARCEEDVVIYDYRVGKKTSLPPFVYDKMLETFELQERNQEACSRQVQELLDRVRSLEQSSWDRPDAVEDLGSATR